MSHTLTEVSNYDTTITVPDDGDDLTSASADGAFQSLANRTKWLGEQRPFDAARHGGNRVWSVGTNIHVNPIQYMQISDTACAKTTESTIDVSSFNTASTWYYVYAKDDGSHGIAFEVSTTAPDANAIFKTGDTTRVYLFCFRTKGSGAPIQFRKNGPQYRYRDLEADFQVITSPGPLNLASFVPPHARSVMLSCFLYNYDTSAGTGAFVQCPGDTNETIDVIASAAVASGKPSIGGMYGVVECDSSQNIDYSFTPYTDGGGNHNQLDMIVRGFEE